MTMTAAYLTMDRSAVVSLRRTAHFLPDPRPDTHCLCVNKSGHNQTAPRACAHSTRCRSRRVAPSPRRGLRRKHPRQLPDPQSPSEKMSPRQGIPGRQKIGNQNRSEVFGVVNGTTILKLFASIFCSQPTTSCHHHYEIFHL